MGPDAIEDRIGPGLAAIGKNGQAGLGLVTCITAEISKKVESLFQEPFGVRRIAASIPIHSVSPDARSTVLLQRTAPLHTEAERFQFARHLRGLIRATQFPGCPTGPLTKRN
jgi:hypothetical protein